MTRAYISLETKLAAALLTMMRPDENGNLTRIISHEDAKKLSPKQIISLFHWDHYPIRKTDGGPDEPWNLEPRLIAEHREKTRKIDIPQVAKQRRIRDELKPKLKRAWPSRKLQSRGFGR